MIKQIFVNLPVKDLQKSIAFFTQLGFTFNPQFTDEQGTCMIMGENIFAMLLMEGRFSDFTTKTIGNAQQTTEVINAMAVESRDKVDDLLKKGIAAGGKESRDAQDHGWMYGRSLEDLDGHQWEFFYADLSGIPQ